jgi:hypothetical protein
MNRTTFLTLVAAVGLAVAAFALVFPAALLAGKGVPPNPAAQVWVREVGVLIAASAVLALLVRKHPASPTLRAFLMANALMHAGLLPIEIVAWGAGALTRLGGIVPNSILHVAFAFGFLFYARRGIALTP